MQLLVAIFDVFSLKLQPDKKKGQVPGTYLFSNNSEQILHLTF